jgi:hypothetical protein
MLTQWFLILPVVSRAIHYNPALAGANNAGLDWIRVAARRR